MSDEERRAPIPVTFYGHVRAKQELMRRRWVRLKTMRRTEQGIEERILEPLGVEPADIEALMRPARRRDVRAIAGKARAAGVDLRAVAVILVHAAAARMGAEEIPRQRKREETRRLDALAALDRAAIEALDAIGQLEDGLRVPLEALRAALTRAHGARAAHRPRWEQARFLSRLRDLGLARDDARQLLAALLPEIPAHPPAPRPTK